MPDLGSILKNGLAWVILMFFVAFMYVAPVKLAHTVLALVGVILALIQAILKFFMVIIDHWPG